MNLQVVKILKNNLSLKKDTLIIKLDFLDTIENKKKAGIPIEPIRQEKKEAVVEIEKVEPKEEKLVSLTFDEGPNKCTNSLLEVLERNRSRATFFILGHTISNNEDMIRKIASSGNEIGLQGFTQTPFTMQSIASINDEINSTIDALENLGVTPSRIVRPPFGKLNATIKDEIKIPFVLSNIDVKEKNKEEIVRKILNDIIPGSIIKLPESEVTVEALNQILPILMKEGYKFVTVSEMNNKYSKGFEFKPGKVYASYTTKNKKAA